LLRALGSSARAGAAWNSAAVTIVEANRTRRRTRGRAPWPTGGCTKRYGTRSKDATNSYRPRPPYRNCCALARSTRGSSRTGSLRSGYQSLPRPLGGTRPTWVAAGCGSAVSPCRPTQAVSLGATIVVRMEDEARQPCRRDGGDVDAPAGVFGYAVERVEERRARGQDRSSPEARGRILL
jgi:hypothetical protein